jgi:hypothetical protein
MSDIKYNRRGRVIPSKAAVNALENFMYALLESAKNIYVEFRYLIKLMPRRVDSSRTYY